MGISYHIVKIPLIPHARVRIFYSTLRIFKNGLHFFKHDPLFLKQEVRISVSAQFII